MDDQQDNAPQEAEEENDMMLPQSDSVLNPQDPEPSIDIQSEEYEEDDQVITYEASIRRTVGPKKKQTCRKTIFQITIIFVALLALNSAGFLILGLPFMKMAPKNYNCKDKDTGEWHSCDKKYICENGLSREEYQPDENDSQYIDNWQNQTDTPMLCESKARIGFLGACFFIGVIVSSTIVPVGYLSDIVGRKWPFVITLVVLALACFGFIVATSLDQLYIFMFLLGTTFPGRLIVGINFAQEFQLESWKEWIQPLNQYTQGITLILTAIYFQFISKKVIYLEIVHFIFVLCLLALTLALFPESPRFEYAKELFPEAKGSLDKVARINGIKNFNKQNFKFDTEKQIEELQAAGIGNQSDRAAIAKKDGGNEYGITTGAYIKNVVLLSLLFTCFSFSFWLSDFQAEYLGTDIYILFYVNGVVCIISGNINLLFYERCGMKLLVIISSSINVISATYIVLVQQHVFKFEDEEQENLFIEISIPTALVFLSCAIQVGFTAVVQTAFQDERIFPFSKKATAINIIVLVSKCATVGAPFVNEEEEPIPIVVIAGLSAAAIILVLFMPWKSELDAMQKVNQTATPGGNEDKEKDV